MVAILERAHVRDRPAIVGTTTNTPAAPRIAIVHEYLTRMGGAERVAHIFAELWPDAPVHTLLYDIDKVGAAFPRWRVVPSGLQKLPHFVRRRPKFLLPFLAEAVEAWDFHEYDIVLSSSSAFAHGIVTDLNTRHICYCHSPARFLWDYAHEYLKEQKLSGWKAIGVNAYLRYLREWNRLSAHRVDRFIANSRTVADRIAKYYRRDADIVYPAVDIDRFQMSTHHEGYFLIVSQLTPYKRIDLAISTFNKLRRRLVIVGDGPQREYLQTIAGPTVEFLGWKSNEAVTDLVANCRAFLLPGEEDFGIAQVEAMAAGKPVIALNAGGATETVIDVRRTRVKTTKPKDNVRSWTAPTGVLFDEPTVASLESGLAAFFANEAKFQPPMIRAHAKQFAREIFVEKMKRIVDAEWQRLRRERTVQ